MADPFSVIANSVGIISLGLSVVQTLYDFASTAKNASSDHRSLESSSQDLLRVLIRLREVLCSDDTTINAADQALIEALIPGCMQHFVEINRFLSRSHDGTNSKGQKVMRGLKWAFKSKQINDIVQRLDSAKETLGIALNIAHRSTMSVMVNEQQRSSAKLENMAVDLTTISGQQQTLQALPVAIGERLNTHHDETQQALIANRTDTSQINTAIQSELLPHILEIRNTMANSKVADLDERLEIQQCETRQAFMQSQEATRQIHTALQNQVLPRMLEIENGVKNSTLSELDDRFKAYQGETRQALMHSWEDTSHIKAAIESQVLPHMLEIKKAVTSSTMADLIVERLLSQKHHFWPEGKSCSVEAVAGSEMRMETRRNMPRKRMKTRYYQWRTPLGQLMLECSTTTTSRVFGDLTTQSTETTLVAGYFPQCRLIYSRDFAINFSRAVLGISLPTLSVRRYIPYGHEAFQMCADGDLLGVHRLLEEREILVTDVEMDSDGCMPGDCSHNCRKTRGSLLHVAASHGHHELCDYLVSKGADPYMSVKLSRVTLPGALSKSSYSKAVSAIELINPLSVPSSFGCWDDPNPAGLTLVVYVCMLLLNEKLKITPRSLLIALEHFEEVTAPDMLVGTQAELFSLIVYTLAPVFGDDISGYERCVDRLLDYDSELSLCAHSQHLHFTALGSGYQLPRRPDPTSQSSDFAPRSIVRDVLSRGLRMYYDHYAPGPISFGGLEMILKRIDIIAPDWPQKCRDWAPSVLNACLKLEYVAPVDSQHAILKHLCSRLPPDGETEYWSDNVFHCMARAWSYPRFRDLEGGRLRSGVKCLTANGADINHQNREGRTPVVEFLKVSLIQDGLYNSYEFLEALVSTGLDLSVEDERGWTPLHYAVLWGNLSFVSQAIDFHLPSQAQLSKAIEITKRARRGRIRLLALKQHGLSPWQVEWNGALGDADESEVATQLENSHQYSLYSPTQAERSFGDVVYPWIFQLLVSVHQGKGDWREATRRVTKSIRQSPYDTLQKKLLLFKQHAVEPFDNWLAAVKSVMDPGHSLVLRHKETSKVTVLWRNPKHHRRPLLIARTPKTKAPLRNLSHQSGIGDDMSSFGMDRSIHNPKAKDSARRVYNLSAPVWCIVLVVSIFINVYFFLAPLVSGTVE